jgi:AmmeMemoRadiSam system protein B
MRFLFAFLLVFLQIVSFCQVPTREEILKEMAIPSTEKTRGQKDGIGYAKTKEQMDEIYKLSEAPPSPLIFGNQQPQKAVAVIVPHDDYVYAGRVYRQLIPLIKAKTVFIIGPLHRWKDFKITNKIVLDSYESWRTPDGDVKVSKVRDLIIKTLPSTMFVQDNTAIDSEHSIEGPLYFLKHSNKDVEIVPILVPVIDFETMSEILNQILSVLSPQFEFGKLKIGDDIGFVISADAVHYGKDFNYTPYGEGGIKAYSDAVDEDRKIITELLSKSVTEKRIRAIFQRFQDLYAPEKSNITWCGRISIPFGLSLSSNLLRGVHGKSNKGLTLYGYPLAYSTSIGSPTLPSKTGLATTAPANLYHFVGYPGIYYDEAIVHPIEQLRELTK